MRYVRLLVLAGVAGLAAVASAAERGGGAFSAGDYGAPSLVTAASILAVLRGGGPKSDGPNFQDMARGSATLLGDRAAQTDALANPDLSQQGAPASQQGGDPK